MKFFSTPLVRLLREESSLDVRRIIAISAVAAVSNALILAVVNAASSAHVAPRFTPLLPVAFVAAVAVYTLAQWFVMKQWALEVERVLHRVRMRLIEQIRRSELREIESIGQARISDALTREIQALSQSCNLLVLTVQLALLVVFSTLYLIMLSVPSFLLAAAFLTVAIIVYRSREDALQKDRAAAARAELDLHGLLTSMIDGFKEIKLNSRRGADFADDLLPSSARASQARTGLYAQYARLDVFAADVFFVLLGVMVFVVPALTSVTGDTLHKIATAILFVIGPLAGIVGTLPVLGNANTSAANIMELERLVNGREHSDEPPVPAAPAAFREIQVRDVVFRFPAVADEPPFEVGPVGLTIAAGEIVFITGGNGSGKTTLLRVLTGLYPPASGTILVDGRAVTPRNIDSYRALFATVFSDFHLFKRLYGIDAGDLDEIDELLATFELAEKTRLAGNTFTTVKLSAGQRKRLALIVALLERRPICVLDEWAADQDPAFRRKFYHELLPMLRARGLTVVAVSHDDRYFDVADRRYHVEDGHISHPADSFA